MSGWDAATETTLTALIDRVVAGDAASWRELMIALAPRFEAWAKASRVLRRCRLTSEDDARAVMVAALERLADNQFANLRRFRDRQAAMVEDDDDLVGDVVRLGKLDDDQEVTEEANTPLRAWLLTMVDFAARDHVRRRLGWSARPGEPSKRDLHTDAAPIDQAPEPSARPPMTDRLTMSKLVAEVQDHIASFPTDMRAALLLWLDDVEFDAIASRLALADAAKARALVRAGQARLRERFRGRSPLLFAS